jgi:hypothetical protein
MGGEKDGALVFRLPDRKSKSFGKSPETAFWSADRISTY